jgi:hypothetical protein
MANKALEQKFYTELAKDVTPSVKEITSIYLMNKGYDGLYNPDCECACKLGEEFMCCEQANQEDCRAGYLRESNVPGEEYRISNRKPI